MAATALGRTSFGNPGASDYRAYLDDNGNLQSETYDWVLPDREGFVCRELSRNALQSRAGVATCRMDCLDGHKVIAKLPALC